MTRNAQLGWLRVLAAAASALLVVQCGSSNNSPTTPSPTPTPTQPAYTVSQFARAMTSSDGTGATQQSGSAPASSGGPAVTPTGTTGVVNGGSTIVRLQSSAAFQTIYMFIGNASVGTVGGYWQLRLPSTTSDTYVVVTRASGLPSSAFDLVYAVATASGAIGAYSGVHHSVLTAGTGQVQVSASWDAASDVDLHVVDPRGDEVYWNNPSVASGGQLDLDSNAACSIDGKNNENIRWSTAPSGTYTVRLDYWSSCSVSQTRWVVTVNNGGSSTLYQGTFSGAGDQGGAGSGRTVTTFSRTSFASDESYDQKPPALFQPSLEKLRAMMGRK